MKQKFFHTQPLQTTEDCRELATALLPDAGSELRRRAGSSRNQPGSSVYLRTGVCCRARAFTLLELMLALIIVAALVPVLYDSLRVGFREKAAAEAAVEPVRSMEIAMDLLRQDLGDAVAPSASTSSLEGPFEGTDGKDDRGCDADDLQFYSMAESPVHDTNNGEIKSIELAVVTAPNGQHVLIRKVIRDLISDQAPNPDVEVICRGIDGFNLRYFDGTAWTDTWDSTAEDNTLPAAVEVTLTLDRDNGPSQNVDGKSCFKFVRVLQLPCSTAAFDSAVNSGGVQ
jgi:type II secretion system protein J